MKTIISIIIATFNSDKLLNNCLNSIYCIENVTLLNAFEVIVIDGGSNDGTKHLLENHFKKFDNFKFISEPDAGIYSAMNKGVKMSSGEWLYFLGSDDILLLSISNISKLLSSLDGYYNIVAGAVMYDNGSIFKSYLNDELYFKNTLHHQAMFYNREKLVDIGAYNESFKILGDFDLNQRLSLKNPKQIKIVDEYISLCGSSGVSKVNIMQLRLERFKLIKSFYKYTKFKIFGKYL